MIIVVWKANGSSRGHIQRWDIIDCQFNYWQLIGIVIGIGSWQIIAIIAIIDWFFFSYKKIIAIIGSISGL